MSLIRASWTIFRKDIALELKTKEILSSMLMFSLLVTVVFSFIFEPGFIEQSRVAGGVYWTAVIFSGLLGLGRSMQSETNGGNLEAILLTPISRNAVFFGKILSNLIFILIVQLVMLPLFVVLYEVNLVSHAYMAAVILGTSYAFALLGTIFSLIAAKSSTREILLPLLLLPVLVPVILAAIQCTNGIAMGEPQESYIKWLRLIIVYGVVFTAVTAVVFDAVVED